MTQAAAARAEFADTVPGAEGAAADGENRGERGRGRRRRRGGRDRDEARDDGATAVATQGDVLQDAEAAPPEAEPLALADAEASPAVATDETGAQPGAAPRDGRRRGGRGNRQRREAREGDEAAVTTQDAEAAPVEPGEVAAREDVLQPQAEATPAPATAEPEAPTAAAVEAIIAAPAAPAAAQAQPAPAAVAAPFVLDADQLRAVAESAGLEWVSSDADKVAAVREALAREPKPIHVPREPKPMVVVDEGPLVLVETRKDLSQFKLPFETAARSD